MVKSSFFRFIQRIIWVVAVREAGHGGLAGIRKPRMGGHVEFLLVFVPRSDGSLVVRSHIYVVEWNAHVLFILAANPSHDVRQLRILI